MPSESRKLNDQQLGHLGLEIMFGIASDNVHFPDSLQEWEMGRMEYMKVTFYIQKAL